MLSISNIKGKHALLIKDFELSLIKDLDLVDFVDRKSVTVLGFDLDLNVLAGF